MSATPSDQSVRVHPLSECCHAPMRQHGGKWVCTICPPMSAISRQPMVEAREVRAAISWMGPHGQRAILGKLGLDCTACGGPAERAPAGPCKDHGTYHASLIDGEPDD